MAAPKAQPFSDAQLVKITKDACNSTLAPATSYVHASTESWNTAIINSILSGLITAAPVTTDSSAPTPAQKPQYKYAVNSTIIQHLSDPVTSRSATATASTGTSTDDKTQQASPPATPNGGATVASDPERGRRGMHSATGAYWNNETDGMWSYKYEGGESKGMDVVISVIWVSVS